MADWRKLFALVSNHSLDLFLPNFVDDVPVVSPPKEVSDEGVDIRFCHEFERDDQALYLIQILGGWRLLVNLKQRPRILILVSGGKRSQEKDRSTGLSDTPSANQGVTSGGSRWVTTSSGKSQWWYRSSNLGAHKLAKYGETLLLMTGIGSNNQSSPRHLATLLRLRPRFIASNYFFFLRKGCLIFK